MELTKDEHVSNESVLCTLLCRFSVESIRTGPKAINYYTDFSNFEHFQFFNAWSSSLGPKKKSTNHYFSHGSAVLDSDETATSKRRT